MPEKSGIQQVVEKAVSEVLEGHFARVQSELVARVLQEIGPQLAQGEGSSDGNPAGLLKAVSSVQSGSTQREILRALLDGAARYTGRVALFVVKAGAATGWQARGFANSEEIKDFNLEAGGLAAQALQSRAPANGPAEQMGRDFVARFRAPALGTALVLPLVLKEKVAALVYADAGTDPGGKLDKAALELLVVTTSAWLEVISLRKQSAKESSAEGASPEKSAPTASSQTPSHAPSFSDPFAGHAPSHVPAATLPVESHIAVAQQAAPAPSMVVQDEPVSQAHAAGSGTAVAMAPDAFASLSAEDAELHRKAQRFARLLVDEIKLYNQAKVAEGRKHLDLYDRLKDDIDKSFSTYQKRYGNTVAASAGYFNGELIRSLAEDDISVMGANFQR
jgi:hypothetical protein